MLWQPVQVRQLPLPIRLPMIASYGRQYELEADQFGASLLGHVGYDPMAAKRNHGSPP